MELLLEWKGGVVEDYLRRLEGVVCGKVYGKEEDAALVRTVSLLELSRSNNE